MTTKHLIATAVGSLLFCAASQAAHAAGPYGWPVKPFHQPHPVRGSFGDPRTVFFGPPTARTLASGSGKFQFHFGVDVSAPNGTAVYPVESGVVTRVTDEEIVVVGARTFEYWHLHAAVRPGMRVTAYATVLGRIARPSSHVHLSELVGGVYVNPLQAGHLTPYDDTTRPTVTRVVARQLGRDVELAAEAEDLPTLPVPGAWANLPVTPATVTWRIPGVTATHVAYDVRRTLPSRSSFWGVYARGTHQNMTTFHQFYAFRQPGRYLFRLGTVTLAPGSYRVVVSATDIRGNSGSRSLQVVVR